MKYTQFLLLKVMEECSEISQRASKAIQFGLGEVGPRQDLDNLQRLNLEIKDLLIVLGELNLYTQSQGGIVDSYTDEESTLKMKKIEKYLKYSEELGEIKIEKLSQ